MTGTAPVLTLLAGHWLSLAGVIMVTTAGWSWLFVLPLHLRGHVDNPYIGIVLFLFIPVLFLIGLVLIPIGVFLGRRRIRVGLAAIPNRRTAYRRLALFFGVTTLANVLIGSQVCFRAVQYMETVQFCGQSCHVMNPQFTAHTNRPHQQVLCVACHVAPGASGWIQSKISGTRQLMMVAFNSYPRPIPSAMETDRLTPASETCENCHWLQNVVGSRLRVIPKYKDDLNNTASYTVLIMNIGGGRYGGIHGAHMGSGVRIQYGALDAKRQIIPWVEYRNRNTGTVRTYIAPDQKAGVVAAPRYEMQCVDCHNRSGHAFDLPERAVDRALVSGRLSPELPYLRREGVKLLKTEYQANQISAALTAFYRRNYSDVSRQHTADIRRAGEVLAAISRRNVFPDLKVEWGTYPDSLGHADFPGCFRCHDDSHATADKKTISQDCALCHNALAVEETSPEVLKTLGISGQIASLREP